MTRCVRWMQICVYDDGDGGVDGLLVIAGRTVHCRKLGGSCCSHCRWLYDYETALLDGRP